MRTHGRDHSMHSPTSTPSSTAHAGHSDHVGQFRRLFRIMLMVAIPVVVFSPMFAMILGYQLPDAAWVDWVSPVLGTVMFVWGGRPFLTGAVSELRALKPGMMLLIALAISVAFLASWRASLGVLDHQLDFWWELALLIVIMLLGHWIEMRSLAKTTSALDSLAAVTGDHSSYHAAVTVHDRTSVMNADAASTHTTGMGLSYFHSRDLLLCLPFHPLRGSCPTRSLKPSCRNP